MAITARTRKPVRRYPVVAQLDDVHQPVTGMEWTRAELRAAAQGGWLRVWCGGACDELAGDCPDLRPLLDGMTLPAEWSGDWR